MEHTNTVNGQARRIKKKNPLLTVLGIFLEMDAVVLCVQAAAVSESPQASVSRL